MNKGYKEYLKGKWIEAEELSKEIGCTDNQVIISIFNMTTQPYYYYLKAKGE